MRKDAHTSALMRRLLDIAVLLPLIVLASYLMGLWAWAARADTLHLSLVDVLLRALGSMVVAGAYEVGEPAFRDWRLEIARLLGALAFVLAASQAIARLLSKNASRWIGRLRRDHLLVVGDHEVARSVAEQAAARRYPVTWLHTGATEPAPIPGALTVNAAWDTRLALAYGARRAHHCVFAFTDEVRQIAAVRALRAQAPGVPMTLNFADPWFGERMDELDTAASARYISLTDLSIRRLHWHHPPFLIAQLLGQARLHALILGFGRAGEAVLSDLLLSSLTSGLSTPRITVIDPDAAAAAASLSQRCPELHLSAEIEFVPGLDASDVRSLPWQAIVAAHRALPITLAYSCLETDVHALSAAIALQAMVQREGWVIGPIVTRLDIADALPRDISGWDGGHAAGLLAFSRTDNFCDAVGLFEADPDAMARALHEGYRQVAPAHAVANTPWEALGEDMREANRRILAHLPAKLVSAGADPSGWLGRGAQTASARPQPSPDLIEELAELEHRRWLAERRLAGWQYGAQRDTLRRRHPDLVDWAALGEPSRAKARALATAVQAAAAAVPLQPTVKTGATPVG